MKKGKGLGKKAGNFDISAKNNVFGELSIRGPKSRLRLHSAEQFPTHNIPDNCVTGILNDLTKVSLLGCITPRIPGSSSGAKGTYYFAKVMPHYIIVGEEFIRPKEHVVTKIVVYVDDAATLFHDFEAFGVVLFEDAEQVVKQIMEKEVHRVGRRSGPNARILYYAGHDEIINVDTSIGRIVIEHQPGFSMKERKKGSPLKDQVSVSIEFAKPLVFEEAISRSDRVIDFLGLLVGRPQNMLDMLIGTEESVAHRRLLRVHPVMASGRRSNAPNGKPHSHDILLDGVKESDHFVSVMKNWLGRHEAWHNARWRFFNSFAEERNYDLNRLVASANMFDVLPDSAVPPRNPLSSGLVAAHDTCKAEFRKLPRSPERESVLDCLGRLGKSSLNRKVKHRAKMLIDEAEESFHDLIIATKEAVKCRNFYVHGSQGSFDYDRNFDVVVFLTETLEMVFAVSDLIEAGWDFKRWLKQPTSMTHPFGRYKVTYRQLMNEMIALLSSTRSPKKALHKS